MTDQPDDRRPAAAENPFESPGQSDNADPAARDGVPIHRSPTAGYICTLLAAVGMMSMGPAGGGVMLLLSAALALCAVPGFCICTAAYAQKGSPVLALAIVLNAFFIVVLLFALLLVWSAVSFFDFEIGITG